MATETASAGLRAAVEAQFLSAAACGAATVETPAFRLHLRPTPHPFYRNVAVPTCRPADWRPAIAAMQAAFRAASCPPRLEFLDELWPDLGPALDDAGLVAVPPLTVMVTRDRPRTMPDGPPVRFLEAAPVAALERYLLAVQRAFDQAAEPRLLPGEVAELARAIATCGCMVAVIDEPGTGFLAGASLIGVDRGRAAGGQRRAELAGVWTAAAARGRGLAARVTASLLDRFLAEGEALVWLAAEHQRATELYHRLGFRPIGRQRHYSAPACGRT